MDNKNLQQKMQEVVEAMKALGFRTNHVELVMMDADRGKVCMEKNMCVGIYDFVRHTFVD